MKLSPSAATPPPATMSLRRGTALNLAGQIVPALAAILAIPVIQRRLGDAQLGVLMLTWAAVGYVGILDLGFRRALTQVVAARQDAADLRRVPALIWTMWWSLAALGTAGGAAIVVAAPRLVPQITAVGPTSAIVAWCAVWSVATSLPFVALSSGVRGVLEGRQRFDLITAVRTPVAVVSYLGPALAALVSPSVAPAMIVLAATRVAEAVALLGAALLTQPALRHVMRWRLEAARDLAATGGWMTVANVAASAMSYLDRFIVGALAPLAAVAYYTTPQELINKLLIISSAISATAFPALAGLWTAERGRVRGVYQKTTAAILVALFLPLLAAALLAPEWLRLWLGPAFAAQSLVVVRWIAVGTLLAGVASAPLAVLQATDHSRVTAILGFIILPLFGIGAWLLTIAYGIEGAAASWTLRMLVETVLLFWAAGRVVPRAVRLWTVAAVVGLAAVVPMVAGASGIFARLFLLFAAAVVTGFAADRLLGLHLRRWTERRFPSGPEVGGGGAPPSDQV